jgi:hypothetical protein
MSQVDKTTFLSILFWFFGSLGFFYAFFYINHILPIINIATVPYQNMSTLGQDNQTNIFEVHDEIDKLVLANAIFLSL